ncbi:tRNA-guanine transglycosylase family protein [Niveomyces insectorum RCEF 264]|uniref:tRNA-guanine transglycosylase family protein n=1 Tax=Niveomyces insectorum RCEF 264 TaxID=1081102 RepID=A0A167X4A9_9HYPO|nr:tRNA-guanine transglycosylase family protein [Niveomyces insectorum RCEF 264]
MTSGAAPPADDPAIAMPPAPLSSSLSSSSSSSSMPLFRLLKTTATAAATSSSPVSALPRTAARLGSLALPGRRPVATPNFLAVASRGVVPHVTPDNATRYNVFDGAYMALEDFIEAVPLHPNRTPPIYEAPEPPATATIPRSSRLHSYTALAPSAVSILAPRRHPAAASHLGNGPNHISIVTSTGFQKLTVDGYRAAIDTLRPDIAVSIADLTYGIDAASAAAVPHPSAKRAVRMAERTEDWLNVLCRDGLADTTPTRVFAPTLPVAYAMQWQYLNRLAELVAPGDPDSSDKPKMALAGLAVYDVDLLPDLDADYATTLAPLPRLSLHPAPTPHHILRQIALGVDVLLLPGITAASEQGLAFTFVWPPPTAVGATGGGGDGGGGGGGGGGEEMEQQPLAIDLSDPAHKTALAPLAPGCACGACAAHHRAYVHHLLDAHEMLAWTLLQIHNHHVVATFLSGVRATLATEQESGADGAAATFADLARRFAAAYEPALPAGEATRPRVRGYQATTNTTNGRQNKPAWGRLDDVVVGPQAP